MKIFLATRNNGKIEELNEMLRQSDFEVVSIKDYPDFPEIVEDGDTFRENAVKKAKAASGQTGFLALADDSGLEVDALKGAPGIYSARFAGAEGDDNANNNKLLRLLADLPAEKRTARFRCVVAIAEPGGKVYTTEGVCEGVIATKPSGSGGFGYDPLFYMPEHKRTFAELDPGFKNRISHRGEAIRGAVEILKKFLT